MDDPTCEVAVVGGGLAGLSAAIYLGRAQRDVLVIDDGKSMARWEPQVQNYLGFPRGIPGADLVSAGRRQARRFGARFYKDYVVSARREDGHRFLLQGRVRSYRCSRLLLASGIFHLPPRIPGVTPCLGKSMFFCKDCDGFRLHGRPVAIYGWTDEAVEYALAMLLFTPCVFVVTDGHPPRWDPAHAGWLEEYSVPIFERPISGIRRRGPRLEQLKFADGRRVSVKALFTVRGDVYYNELAAQLGAKLDRDGEVIVDAAGRTSVPGLYAAGCVTPANCQMIIAAGQGATAAQAINRELFELSLKNHTLRRYRERQIQRHRTKPRTGRKAPKPQAARAGAL